MIGIIFFLPIAQCLSENLLVNPSFETLREDTGMPVNWDYYKGFDVSNEFHSGSKSVHIVPPKEINISSQSIIVSKGNRYDVCIYYKTRNVNTQLQFYIETYSESHYEGFYSTIQTIKGTVDWTQSCFTTDVVSCPNGNYYSFGYYTINGDNAGDVYIDDVSVFQSNDYLRNVAINNDRDEVEDTINVVFHTYVEGTVVDANSWKMITTIIDNDGKEMGSLESVGITSNLRTVKMDVSKLNLKANTFYKVRGTLINNELNVNQNKEYPFKKIDKTKRKVIFDEYHISAHFYVQ